MGAVAIFGISLGALTSGLASVAALLACPVGVYLMMRIMNKKGEAVIDFNDVSANCE